MWLIKKKNNNTFKYIINFKNEKNDLREMHFLLNNSEASKKFIDIIRKTKKKSINKNTYTHSFDADPNSANIIKDKLNRHIKIFNELQNKNSLFRFDLFEFSGNKIKDQQFLNKQHSNFEKWAGDIDLLNKLKYQENYDKAKYELNKINNTIHLLESKLKTKYSADPNNPFIYGRVSFTTNERFRLKRKWYKYFSMGLSFGDLRMNYATRGKNLGHLYKDNDLMHLKNGSKPMPQKTFNTGVNIFFGGYSLNKLSENNCIKEHSETLIKLKKWIIDNQLKEKYGIDYNPYQCPGYIVLGRFIPTGLLNYNSTILDVFNYYFEYQYLDDYYIEEIKKI